MAEKIKNSPFLKIGYITVSSYSLKSFLDYNFFLVLEGSLRILQDKETFFLGKNDVFLFEAGNEYHISSAGNNIILSVTLDSRFFQNDYRQTAGHYTINSVTDTARDYTPLRQLLLQIAHTASDPADARGFHLLSHAYRLLYYLDVYHYEAYRQECSPMSNNRYQERMNLILNYIHRNYASTISLQEAADTLHLSPQYLSAFFRQSMNENFSTYVNHVRLKHAVDELLHTDKSITAIAFDNGFASTNAFNKLFKEKYQTTPMRYRKNMLEKRTSLPASETAYIQELEPADYAFLLEDYKNSSDIPFDDIRFPSREIISVTDMHSSTPVAPIWRLLINIGSLRQLSLRDIEQQLIQLQDSAGFSYARIEAVLDWQLLSPRQNTLMPDSFSAFHRAIDILQVYHLIPYLDLSVPFELLSISDHNSIIVDLDYYLELLETLLQCSVNQYGPEYMQSWYYEISPHRHFARKLSEEPQHFLRRFLAARKLIKQYLPSAKVGGLCYDTILPCRNYQLILEQLTAEGIRPDFFSIGIFPYEQLNGPESLDDTFPEAEGLCYTLDPHYALHKLSEFKQLLASWYETVPEIHMAYLAPDCFHGHYLNDTCFQASFFFHNTVDLLGELDMLGYYRLSDISSHQEEHTAFLDGRTGLFNKYGIRKPGAHLLDIFSNCQNNLVQKGENYVVLKGPIDRYMIGLCNYTYISEQERFSLHQQIPIANAYKTFESPQTKNVELLLNNLAVGTYEIILFQINKKHGSLLDEWARNEYWNHFSRDDLDYMRKKIQPMRTHYTRTTTDGFMQFQFQLEPHEVIFIALLHRW